LKLSLPLGRVELDVELLFPLGRVVVLGRAPD